MMFQNRKQKEAWEAAHPVEFGKLEQYGILDGSDGAADAVARRTIGQPEAANSDEPIAVCDPRDVKPLTQPKYTLEGMLDGMTEANLHPEFGAPDPRYRTLRTILDAAFAHAATGKGKERHARDLPFDDQPMLETTRLVGPGFPLGQAIKKAGEAAGMIERGELSAAEAECLGAINYLAGAVLWMRERAQERKVAA